MANNQLFMSTASPLPPYNQQNTLPTAMATNQPFMSTASPLPPYNQQNTLPTAMATNPQSFMSTASPLPPYNQPSTLPTTYAHSIPLSVPPNSSLQPLLPTRSRSSISIVVRWKFWEDQPKLSTILQIVLFVLLVIAVAFCASTIGVFGKQYQDLKKIANGDDACFIFIGYYHLGKNSYCNTVIAGHSIALILLIVLTVFHTVILFIRLSYRIHLLVVFLTIIALGLLLSIISSVILSAGFAKNCKTIKDVSNGQAKCSDYNFGGDFNVYDNLKSSTACSWVDTLVIGGIVFCAVVLIVSMKMDKVQIMNNN